MWCLLSIEHQWFVLGVGVLIFGILLIFPLFSSSAYLSIVRLFSFWYNSFEIHRNCTHSTLTWTSSCRNSSVFTSLHGFHCVLSVECVYLCHSGSLRLFYVFTYESEKSIWITINNILFWILNYLRCFSYFIHIEWHYQ